MARHVYRRPHDYRRQMRRWFALFGVPASAPGEGPTMLFLKQSTATTFRIGPFVDEDDGKTAEGGLTLTQADFRLSKDGGAYAQKNDATGGTHDENGWYTCVLDTTDTNTLGALQIAVHESGALAVWHDAVVLPANVYDSMIDGSDSLQVDTVALSGDTTAADNAEADYDGTGYAKANSTMGTVTTITGLNDPTAAAIVNEWETQSQADPTGFHVNAREWLDQPD